MVVNLRQAVVNVKLREVTVKPKQASRFGSNSAVGSSFDELCFCFVRTFLMSDLDVVVVFVVVVVVVVVASQDVIMWNWRCKMYFTPENQILVVIIINLK